MNFIRERPGVSLLLFGAVAWFFPLGGATPADLVMAGLIKLLLLLFWVVAAAFYVMQLWKRPEKPRVTPEDARTVAEFQAKYPFLTPQAAVFNNYLYVQFTSDPPGINHAMLRKLVPTSAADWKRAYAVLQRAAIWEMRQRGYRITNDTNAFIAPNVSAHGFVVETTENDDGSVDAIVVTDIDEPVSQRDYDEAWREVGLAGPSHEWKRTLMSPWQLRYMMDSLVPLYKPVLRTVRLADAPSNENPFRPRSTEKGAAQWAWVDEMQASPKTGYLHRTEADWSQRFDAPGAPLGGFFKSNHGPWPVEDHAHIFMQGEGHRIILGPSGTGKFTAVFAPLLLMADNASAVVFDIKKGEAARITAPWRATLGPVYVIDPFGVSGLESDSLNPLDFLDPKDPDILQAAQRLTEAVFITPPGGSNEEYFNDQAREVLTAYLLHVATDFSEEKHRNLTRVRNLIRRPLDPAVLAAMQDNDIADGYVRDVAATLIEARRADAERNTFFVTRTLAANTGFLDLGPVRRATAKTTFRPEELRERVATLYVCLPFKELETVGRWLRLVYASIMERVGSHGDVPLHFLIDEFPAFGKFPRVSSDMALVRDFGIHMHIVAQSLSMLEQIYGTGWQSFLTNARYQQLLGVNDQMTPDYFAAALGKTTRRSTSTSHSRSTGGGSQSESAGWESADLLSSDEIRRMPPEATIVLVEGMNPLTLIKHHYFDGGLLDARISPKAGERENAGSEPAPVEVEPELAASDIYPKSERKQEMLRMLLTDIVRPTEPADES